MFPVAADTLLAFQRCQRQPYLEQFGPEEARQEPSDFLKHLRRDRQALLADIKTAFPGDSAGVWQPKTVKTEGDRLEQLVKRAECTRSLMNAGIERIYDGVLLDISENGDLPPLMSFPDVLIRLERQDVEDRWYYMPAIVRTGKQVKPPYRLALAILTYLLERTRGHVINGGQLVLRDRVWRRVDLTHARAALPALLQDFATVIERAEAPDVHMSRSRCSLCTWYDHCLQHARATRPLALLPGVTAPRFQALQTVGIETVNALAEAEVDALQNISGLGRTTARKLIFQARAARDDKAISIEPYTLPRAEVELYFDIEADLARNAAYLLGVLVIDRKTETCSYRACLADDPDDEGTNWLQFLDLVALYPEAPVYHFHSFEIQTCRRLTEQYGTDRAALHALLARMVDLHPIVSQCVVLPTESYSLKHIARWLGFSWRQSDADGAQSIFWYAQWLETGDRNFLNATVTYNEDDCRATYHLKQWLETRADLGHVEPDLLTFVREETSVAPAIALENAVKPERLYPSLDSGDI
ncbi:MAG: TM0106 family RecB-like putative nuclease [Cyanobacteria bacterium P01_E01_bin.48]